jgi:hypothetical protein
LRICFFKEISRPGYRPGLVATGEATMPNGAHVSESKLLRATPFLLIPVLAYVVFATAATMSNRVRSTSVWVMPDVEMHLPPLALEGAITLD